MRSSILTADLLQLKRQFESLNPDQQAIFLDLVDPLDEPTAKTKPKRQRKSSTKSSRASKLGEQLKTNLAQRPKEPICTTCGNVEDYEDHSEPSPSYHPFAPSVSAVAAGATL